MNGGDLRSAGQAWLEGPGRRLPDARALLDAFSAALTAFGLPLARATTHAPTLHPSFRWVMRVWRPGERTQTLRRAHGVEATAIFHGNTVEHVVATGSAFRARLEGREPLAFPVLDELRADGLTDYLIVPLPAGAGRTGAASWATRRTGGFTEGEVEALTALAVPLSLVFELKAHEDMLEAVLGTYVGRDPAQRILAGSVRRGDVHTLRAALLLTDMRDFGVLSDTHEPAHVVAVLNRMFDAIVPAVEAEGGEVLKYIGDGLLAVFDAGRDEAQARAAAYRAARTALEAAAAGHLPDIGIALHVGEVAYGNIGGGERLDFTAIGRDVNIVARIEGLCKHYGRTLLATAAFARGLTPPLEAVDTVDLRGFRASQVLYGLPAERSATPRHEHHADMA